jgi:M6 family metalloprotease-like protein
MCGIAFAAAPLKLNYAHSRSVYNSGSKSDTLLRVCALRVQFVEDQVTGTTGTGRMGSGFDSSLTIDPLPHDRAYFEDHLSFLKHYYETVSNRRLRFETLTVFPASDTAVYQLDYPMWHYNYNNGDTELLNRRLTELFVQAVGKATDVDFSQFDAIFIFHAGVGKDFNLGYDYTPFDIPSAYITEEDIRRYTPDAVLPDSIKQGIILPEGENQAEALEYDIELSLNGIMVKLFGNWLGLPDLFDTQTGNSGIGRWGMMDQGSGNVSALVPAMPEAWSRAKMRWEDVLDILPSATGDTVRIARFGHNSEARIVRFPITPREYYLVENRDSDADSIGYVELKDRGGNILRVDHDGNFAVQSGFRVAVEANRYDFGIPGSGLLIWHIDEDVIEAGMADNSVNTDPDHRGVDLVEADGAQDIGNSYGIGSSGSGTELGIAEDAWYFNNKEHRAANNDAQIDQFSARTFPAAKFYDGSYPRLDLTDFSTVDTVMSFVARLDGLQPGFPVSFAAPADWAVADLDGDSVRDIYFIVNDSLFQRDSFLVEISHNDRFAGACPAVDLDGDGRDELIFEGSRIGFAYWDDGAILTNWDSTTSSSDQKVYPARNVDSTGGLLGVTFARDTLTAIWYNMSFDTVGERKLSTTGIYSVLNVESFPALDYILIVPGLALNIRTPGMNPGFEQILASAQIEGTGTIVAEPDRRSVFLTGYGYMNIADGATLCYIPECLPPLEDWDQDGIPDGGGRLGRQDAPRENFPRFSADVTHIYDLEADGDPDLLGYSKSSDAGNTSVYTRISAVSHEGAAYSFFPVAASAVKDRELFLWDRTQTLFFLTVAQANGEYSYGVNRLTSAVGTRRFVYREPANIINVGPLRPQVHARGDWVYCWPNPAATESRIRITLPYPARATAQIFDLAGRRIASLQDKSDLAGAFEIVWNVEHVESGVYLARVKAEGGGQTHESQIKIAVVK